MNNTLTEKITHAEGRYLADSELSCFHDLIDSYALRQSAYLYLQENADTLVLQTLRRLMPNHRQVIQQHSDLCKRDMSYVLRCAAFAALRNDEEGFVQELVLWMQNILSALKKEQQSLQFYEALRAVIEEQMPPQEAGLINRYLNIFIDALKAVVQE